MSPDAPLCPVVERPELETALHAPESPLDELELLVAPDHVFRRQIAERALHYQLSVDELFPAPGRTVRGHAQPLPGPQLNGLLKQRNR